VLLDKLCDHLTGSVDMIIAVDNAPIPAVTLRPDRHVVHYPETPINLSRAWNIGFTESDKLATRAGHSEWDIIVLNDDVVLPTDWVQAVCTALRTYDVTAACSDPYGTLREPLVKREPDNTLTTRMCPWAFVLRGERHMRANEDLRWWWGDTDLEWQICHAGGLVMLPGYRTENLLANTTTIGVFAEQAGRDRLTFIEKWGLAPW